MSAALEVRSVLAGAYRGRKFDEGDRGRLLTHYYRDGAARSLCGRIKEENLCDVNEGGVASCSACIARNRMATKGERRDG